MPALHLAVVALFALLFLDRGQKKRRERLHKRDRALQEDLIDMLDLMVRINLAGLEELRLLIPRIVQQLTEQSSRVTVVRDAQVLFEAGQDNLDERSLGYKLEMEHTNIQLEEEPPPEVLSALTSLTLALNNRVLEIQSAIRDDHTGLYGKGHFLQALDYEVERARRYGHEVSIIMLDVDHFKRHNDCYGHPSGDKALLELARIFSCRHRRADTVARYGGEEFALLLPETGAKDALELAEILRTEVERQRFEGEDENEYVRLTISLGVATYPTAAKDPEALLKKADEALYASKNAGRNRTSIAPCDGAAN